MSPVAAVHLQSCISKCLFSAFCQVAAGSSGAQNITPSQWRPVFYHSVFIASQRLLVKPPRLPRPPAPPPPGGGKCFQAWLRLTSVFLLGDPEGEQKQQCDVLQPSSYTITLSLFSFFFFFFTAVGSEGNNVSTTPPPPEATLDAFGWLSGAGPPDWGGGGSGGGGQAGRGRCNEFVLMVSVAQRHCNTNSSIVVTARLCCFMSH